LGLDFLTFLAFLRSEIKIPQLACDAILNPKVKASCLSTVVMDPGRESGKVSDLYETVNEYRAGICILMTVE
jgi:hypothetical protein